MSIICILEPNKMSVTPGYSHIVMRKNRVVHDCAYHLCICFQFHLLPFDFFLSKNRSSIFSEMRSLLFKSCQTGGGREMKIYFVLFRHNYIYRQETRFVSHERLIYKTRKNKRTHVESFGN